MSRDTTDCSSLGDVGQLLPQFCKLFASFSSLNEIIRHHNILFNFQVQPPSWQPAECTAKLHIKQVMCLVRISPPQLHIYHPCWLAQWRERMRIGKCWVWGGGTVGRQFCVICCPSVWIGWEGCQADQFTLTLKTKLPFYLLSFTYYLKVRNLLFYFFFLNIRLS